MADNSSNDGHHDVDDVKIHDSNDDNDDNDRNANSDNAGDENVHDRSIEDIESNGNNGDVDDDNAHDPGIEDNDSNGDNVDGHGEARSGDIEEDISDDIPPQAAPSTVDDEAPQEQPTEEQEVKEEEEDRQEQELQEHQQPLPPALPNPYAPGETGDESGSRMTADYGTSDDEAYDFSYSVDEVESIDELLQAPPSPQRADAKREKKSYDDTISVDNDDDDDDRKTGTMGSSPVPVPTSTPASNVASLTAAARAETAKTGAPEKKQTSAWQVFLGGFVAGVLALGIVLAAVFSDSDDSADEATNAIAQSTQPPSKIPEAASNDTSLLPSMQPADSPTETSPPSAAVDDPEAQFYDHFETLMGPLIRSPSTPHKAAADWILMDDPRITATSTSRIQLPSVSASASAKQLDFSDPLSIPPEQLEQRYLMAFFYFAFSDTGLAPWEFCSPPSQLSNTSTRCEYFEYRDGPNVKVEASRWLTADSECQWAGVVCNEALQVGSVSLHDFALVGSLASEIMLLPTLAHLSLTASKLGGTIPLEYSKLVSLNLTNNEVTGEIPAAFFTVASSMTDFDLANNTLVGPIPPQIGSAGALQIFNVANNSLTSFLPTEIDQLQSLKVFNVANNGLVGSIPAIFGSFDWTANLVELVLSGNGLEGELPSLNGLARALERFEVADNGLDGRIPISLGSLTHLVVARLDNNLLTGPIPTELGVFKRLERLWLNDNPISFTIPSELGWLSSLKEARFGNTLISGSVPTELCSLDLTTLSADCFRVNCTCCTVCTVDPRVSDIRNGLAKLLGGEDKISNDNQPLGRAMAWIISQDPAQLLFSSPNFVQRFVLAAFYFQMSQLGSKPWRSCNPNFSDYNDETCDFEQITEDSATSTASKRWLSSAPETTWSGVNHNASQSLKVERLYLPGQELLGHLPDELTLLSDLTHLLLPHNSIQGTLPPAYGDSSKFPLVALDLRDNMIIGTLADGFFANSQTLEKLNLGVNMLVGRLPSSIFTTQSLQSLNLTHNNLTDEVPVEISYLASLTSLDLSYNLWRGEVPTELGVLSRLEHLIVGGYRGITGQLPTEIGKLTRLRLLDISNTKMRGKLPAEIGNLLRLQSLDVSNSEMTEQVPSEYGLLSNLQFLNMAQNKLAGSIPTTLGLLTELVDLRLNGNNLIGPIPTEFGLLTDLEVLHMQANELNGIIGAELGLMTSLMDLRLNHNNFNGTLPISFVLLGDLRVALFHANSIVGPIPTGVCSILILEQFMTDCNSQPPTVDCSCCTQCCVPQVFDSCPVDFDF